MKPYELKASTTIELYTIFVAEQEMTRAVATTMFNYERNQLIDLLMVLWKPFCAFSVYYTSGVCAQYRIVMQKEILLRGLHLVRKHQYSYG
jgi:hypothetical protein